MSAALADDYDALLLDLDGVVYTGRAGIPHAAEVLGALAACNQPRLGFVTNNASRTPEEVAALLCSVGVTAEPADVVTSAQAAATLLAARLTRGAAVLVVGGDGLRQAVLERGLRLVSRAAEAPAAVVQGYAPEVGWSALAEAAVAVRAGALWVATNTDATIPSERGPLPGNGALVAAVATAARRQPDLIAGKPERALHDEAVRRLGASRPLVVGDRLDTDIEGASRVGADSLLVLTGVTRPADLPAAPPEQRPTVLAADLRALDRPRPTSPVLGEDTASVGGWRASVGAGEVRLAGSGDPVDGLRAALALCWATGTEQVVVPEELRPWWGSPGSATA